jgi:uncharacterized membrane protein YfcA
MDPWLIVFGFGVGILVGTTGMGGGSLMTPLLILLFGIKPVVAVGTDLAYAAITKTAGGFLHLRKGTVQTSLAWWLAIGSCPGAILGVVLLERLGLEDILLPLIGAALLLTGGLVLLRALISNGAGERKSVPLNTRHKVAAVVLGASVGFVLGLTSAGSGTLIAIGLILGFRLVPRRVVGTDVFHAAILLWAAGLAHVSAGNVDFGLVGNILIGSIPGVWVGSHYSIRVPAAVLRTTLAVVLIGAGIALLIKAGLDLPLEILIPFPVAVIVLLVITMVRGRRARKSGEIQIPSGM